MTIITITPVSLTTIKWSIIPVKFDSKELWAGYGYWVCIHYDLDLGYLSLGQGHDTPLSHGRQLCEILSRSKLAVKSYGPDTDTRVCEHCDIGLGDMTLRQGHDTALSHGQQSCEILSGSNLAVMCYVPDMDFRYFVHRDLDLRGISKNDIWGQYKTNSYPVLS